MLRILQTQDYTRKHTHTPTPTLAQIKILVTDDRGGQHHADWQAGIQMMTDRPFYHIEEI